jgi:6,7-dimethyl-8-ribityllumazine synthase
VEVVRVPGAFELPHRAMKMAASGRYRAVVAVGCILAGDTPHHRYLSQAAISGLALAGVLSGVPVTCGVITAQSWSKAMERSRPKGLNRGREAAKAAWEMSRANGK